MCESIRYRDAKKNGEQIASGSDRRDTYHQPQTLKVTESGRNHARHARNAFKEKNPLYQERVLREYG